MATAPARQRSRSLIALSGIAWLLFQTLGSRMASVVGQIFLAQLLSPAIFGAISLVYGLTSIASAIASFGVDTVLLQRHRTMRLWFPAAFWTTAALGLVGFALTVAVSPFLGRIYRSPDYVTLATAFAISIPLTAITTVPTVVLRSRLNFKFPAIYNVCEFFALQCLTVLLAWRGFGVFSFVLPPPTLALVKLVVFTLKAPYSPFGPIKLSQLSYLLRSGASLFTSKLTIQVVSQGDFMILGLLATKTEVGVYYFAFKLATQAIWIIAGNVTNVILPMLVKSSGNPPEQAAVTWTICRLMAYTAIPACFLQAMISHPLLELLFGSKWLAAAPIMACLSIGLGFDTVTWITASYLNARKRYARGLILNLAFAPLFFLLAYAGAKTAGGLGTAVGVAVYYFILGPSLTALSFTRAQASLTAIFALFAMPTLFATLAFCVGKILSLYDWPQPLLIVEIAAQCLAFGVVFLLLTARFSSEVLRDLFQRFLPQRYSRLAFRLPP